MSASLRPPLDSNFLTGDDALRATNDDALISRLCVVSCTGCEKHGIKTRNRSAAQLGYLDDPFAKLLLKRSAQQRRPPVINRGTYLRWYTITGLMKQFLGCMPSDKPVQIISLGAGSCTRYFQLKSNQSSTSSSSSTSSTKIDTPYQNLRYFELDFPQITTRKAMAIKKNKSLLNLLEPASSVTLKNGGTDLTSDSYCLLAADLREWEAAVTKMKDNGFDTSAPTLWVSECFLVYLNTEHSRTIVDWISTNCALSMMITYEQILPNDAFGKTMVDNLRRRGIELPGIFEYPTLESQVNRFKGMGWQRVEFGDMIAWWDKGVTQEERERVSKVEVLDELEEWTLLMTHYCLGWSVCWNKEQETLGNKLSNLLSSTLSSQ